MSEVWGMILEDSDPDILGDSFVHRFTSHCNADTWHCLDDKLLIQHAAGEDVTSMDVHGENKD